MPFVKLHTDILGDAKLLRAARKGAGALFLLPWLLAFAKDADDEGRLTVNGEPAELDDIAPRIPCATKKMVGQCLTELESIGVLVRDQENTDTLRFARWDARAGKDSDSAEATRERKRRQRAQEKSRPVTRDTSTDVTPTSHAVDVDVDVDVDVEKEKKSVTVTRVTFEDAWAVYPKRAGTNSRRDAEHAWSARVRAGADPAAMLEGARRYRAYCDGRGQTGTEFVMQAVRFFGPSGHYLEAWEAPNAMPAMYEADGVTYTPDFLAWAARTSPNGRMAS